MSSYNLRHDTHVGHRDSTKRTTVPCDRETLSECDHGVEGSSVCDTTSKTGGKGCVRLELVSASFGRRAKTEPTGVGRVANQDSVDAESGLVDNLLHDRLSQDGQEQLQERHISRVL